jgi:hypothetical protein
MEDSHHVEPGGALRVPDIYAASIPRSRSDPDGRRLEQNNGELRAGHHCEVEASLIHDGDCRDGGGYHPSDTPYQRVLRHRDLTLPS